MARILVGVTGGIAAYKACELVRLLVRSGHEVFPLVTPGAQRFVSEETFTALARRSPSGDPYRHLTQADLLVVAPLSANTLAKLAHGLADNVLTEAALAHDGPVVAAPAMNSRMWTHPATRANAEVLRRRGVELVGPEEGELAEGGSGPGRMSEPEAIAARCEQVLARGRSRLRGRSVLVTAGGTREPLDSVRYVGNRSSGRMGVALADEAQRRGADVTLVAANLAVAPPPGVDLVDAPTAEAMRREVLARADGAIVLMAAAVADYRPVDPRADKRPKDGGRWRVDLEPTADIAAELGARERNGQVLVAFGADHGQEGLARKRGMLERKRVDLVVFNDVGEDGIGFDASDNEVVLVSRAGERTVERARKEVVAAAILDEVELLLP
jgi:phosphopantothenoylcysteine decarboxylase/phosphopantothenate--cysteine ligase